MSVQSQSQEMPAKLNTSIYTPLKDEPWAIRLLNLLPGASREDLECELIPGSWDTSSYEALSYVWGSPKLSMTVKSGNSLFFVTKNLYDALKHLRFKKKPRVLWIDAMCINQTDDSERTQQVRQMRSIYENASAVIVWLGFAPDGIKRIFARAHESGKFLPLKRHAPEVEPLSQLLGRPWWRRIWVIQELIVAKVVVVQCGVHTIPWEGFSRLVNGLLHLDKQIDLVIPEPHKIPQRLFKDGVLLDSKSLMNLRDDGRFKMNHKLGILGLAYLFRRREASDGRDKLYALLGLLSSREGILMEPDYTKEEQVVFKEFARAWINRYHSLLIIAVPRDSSEFRWYPSWSVHTRKYNEDWTIPFWWDTGLDPEMPISPWERTFHAAGGHPAPNCTHHINQSITHFRGFVSDTIVATSKNSSPSLVRWYKQIEKRLAEWEQLALSSTGKSTAEIQESFQYTVTAGVFGASPPAEQEESYIRARNAACKNRRFFVTKKGSLGLGPWWTQAEDKVCILLGADVPFVLRESQNHLDENWEIRPGPRTESVLKGEGRSHALWELVGEAYVREIMNYKGSIEEDIEDGMAVLEDFFFA